MRNINLPIKIVNGEDSYLLVRDLTIVPFYLQGSVSTQDLAHNKHNKHNKVTPFYLSAIQLVISFNVCKEEVKEWGQEKPIISLSDHNLLCPERKTKIKLFLEASKVKHDFKKELYEIM